MSLNNSTAEPLTKKEQSIGKTNVLYLYNDDTNTFDHVIECLVVICKHDVIQAEQCACIANYKGKCEIKKGKYEILKNLKTELLNKGLIVSIE